MNDFFDNPFGNQFYMIFDETGQVVDTVNFSPVLEKHEEWAHHGGAAPAKVFHACLSVVDRGRFLALCDWKPSRKDRTKRRNMAIFCLDTFYGYPFALAEKNVTVSDDLVYIRFFNRYTEFVDYATMVYREYLTAWGRYRALPPETAGDAPLSSTPPFMDLFRLTDEIVTNIRTDPGFYGNRLSLGGDGIRFLRSIDWTDREKRRYPLYFSAPVLAGTVYAVLTALANATCTHEMLLSLDREGENAVFRLQTKINTPKKVARKVPSTFSEYDVMLLTFAFNLARTGYITPSAWFSEEDRMLTVMLRVTELFPREGDFRCGETEVETGLACILEDAKTFAALFPASPSRRT